MDLIWFPSGTNGSSIGEGPEDQQDKRRPPCVAKDQQPANRKRGKRFHHRKRKDGLLMWIPCPHSGDDV
ncbi:hypothetical protein NHX12_011482 [Muraenolepis orangiensis]|uniref:Uncharacterized protein n=1 Tax=Muraenolepis orangiensis TaxID=630683 RepID=A0A9Q0DGI2_9TELE|nr:hypothetical protein NHX12_011482 [Muraenolepis orangiensis]